MTNTQVKLSNKKPPVFNDCEKQFGIKWSNTVFAYDDTIHAEHPESLSKDIILHECVHLKQQKKIGVKVWWERYFKDDSFRLSQELEAYRVQFEYIKTIDRNYAYKRAMDFATVLSGEMYGKLGNKTFIYKQIIN